MSNQDRYVNQTKNANILAKRIDATKVNINEIKVEIEEDIDGLEKYELEQELVAENKKLEALMSHQLTHTN